MCLMLFSRLHLFSAQSFSLLATLCVASYYTELIILEVTRQNKICLIRSRFFDMVLAKIFIDIVTHRFSFDLNKYATNVSPTIFHSLHFSPSPSLSFCLSVCMCLSQWDISFPVSMSVATYWQH